MKKNYLFPEDSYQATDEVLISQTTKVFEAVTKSIHGNIFIINLLEKKIDYIPYLPFYISEGSIQDIKTAGLSFLRKITASEDHHILDILKKTVIPFFNKLPINDRTKYIINFDSHIKSVEKRKILLNYKVIPFELDHKGNIKKAICNLSLSLKKSSGNIQISSDVSDLLWLYDLKDEKWVKTNKKKLTYKEFDVFRYYLQGLTIPEIAKKTYLSSDTVKWHRRKLFEKLDVSNITEALAYAVTNDLI
ncbi:MULTISPECIES: response regulator transcription factor [unclassified Chryseobacterium]|jgi:DNA-binding CsgD family transcriptional regulator|uniref:response regulator transcription factor n=1 Tax=unclassified Chryseobacterium TaxID=2593645 RepID=UPI001C5A8C66|nr:MULTISPECIES: helix-turn-helix transcriptional regulator [unclassified Chryseobacterium]MBW3523498.1 helix-turn-helix transcriptional regulator [Chryseobacterium sp. NKUCC03_KSP]MCD0456969.1 helix-turn-helix transcriptional regulator [Chryseobacterium sp. LC2016-27]